MSLHELEREIYDCPYAESSECKSRFKAHPIPGGGSSQPEFLIIGINPALRKGIWRSCICLEALKRQYLQECRDSRHGYGRLLKRLQEIIPNFHVPETVYLTDIVKCPTIDGKPSKAMMAQCKEAYFKKTVQTLKPKFIIVLGDLPFKLVNGVNRTGKDVKSFKIVINTKAYWSISAPHPSQAANTDAIANSIHKVLNNPEATAFSCLSKGNSKSKVKEAKTRLEKKLVNLGYRKQYKGNSLVKGQRIVDICCSSEFGSRMRILWREQWKNDYAVIYDYSAAGGPVCIVPIDALFSSSFIIQKRGTEAYGNSKYWWSQLFPLEHALAKLVINYKERWDLL